MPQMSPMDWLMLMNFNIILSLITISLIYFLFKLIFLSKNMSPKNSSYMFHIKW